MNDKITEAAKIIAKNVFAMLIYAVEHDNRVDFVYFADNTPDEDIINAAQESALKLLGCDVGILDIRDFTEFDRIQLIQKGVPIYSISPVLPQLAENKAIETMKTIVYEKSRMCKMKKECGSFFYQ